MREKTVFLRQKEGASLRVSLSLCFVLVTCGEIAHGAGGSGPVKALVFGSEQNLGKIEKNPSTPFLRYSPDGRLYAVWTEDHDTPWSPATSPAQHQHGMVDRAPSPMRNALLAYSTDGGKSWSSPRRINDAVEAVQGEENGPRIVFGPENRAYAVWSIPGDKGDKTRANIRFALDEGKGGFTPAKTLNEVKDAARFPVLELSPDGNLLVAWIDRRIDNPKPRQLYLMQLDPDGKELTKNYSAGEGLCECCKLGVAFATGARQFT